MVGKIPFSATRFAYLCGYGIEGYQLTWPYFDLLSRKCPVVAIQHHCFNTVSESAVVYLIDIADIKKSLSQSLRLFLRHMINAKELIISKNNLIDPFNMVRLIYFFRDHQKYTG